MQEHCHLGKGLRERKGHTCPHQHSKNTESNELTTEFRGLEKNFWGDLGTPEIGRKHRKTYAANGGTPQATRGSPETTFPVPQFFPRPIAPPQHDPHLSP